MKFKSDTTQNAVEISELNIGDTFIDSTNFSGEDVFMIINTNGYDCHIGFDDDTSEIAVVNLTSGELWAYTSNEEVIPVSTEEIKYKIG